MTHRTDAADQCPDWEWREGAYQHRDCPNGTIDLFPGGHVPIPSQSAMCRGCGAVWHRPRRAWDAVSAVHAWKRLPGEKASTP